MLDPKRPLTLAEANRAIYIDFEGFQDQPPALLGILDSRALEQVALDPRLARAAAAKNLRVSDLGAEVSRLLNRCGREQNWLVGFTTHECTVCRRFASVSIDDRYRDAYKIAKGWKKRLHGDRPIEGWSLRDFLVFIGMPRDSYLRTQQSTQRLGAVLEMLDRKRDFHKLTPTVKAKWTKSLQNNAVDCHDMRTLMLKVAEEMS